MKGPQNVIVFCENVCAPKRISVGNWTSLDAAHQSFIDDLDLSLSAEWDGQNYLSLNTFCAFSLF